MKTMHIEIIFVFMILFIGIFNFAYGDGLTQENLPPASVGDREASLFIKINPPILTKDTVGDTFIELKLFDAKTGDVIKHTSFFVTVDKEGKLLMRNLFHTHSGDLTIKVQPTNVGINEVVVYGDQEPFQGGWTSINDQISVKAPILLEAGLYHFEIEIFGIDNDRNIFIPKDAPKFDSWLSVGDIFNQTISSQGSKYETSIISYYDKIQNFKFDQSTKTFSFNMPFNWNTTRIEPQNIFVHEEIHFPNSFKDFTSASSYNAKVNGNPISGRMLIADPYSLENTLILHFLISKNNILDFAKTIPTGTKTMDFSISPGSSSVNEKNTFDIKFDNGAKAKVAFDKNLGPGKIPFEITFFDKDGKLLKFVRHGIRIEDSAGKTLFEDTGNDPNSPGILSTEGIDTQTFTLPSAGKYKLTVAIFSHGIDNVQTYAGIASNFFEITKSSGTTDTLVVIPSWIKNNAAWWADNKIGDSDFVQGIQWLIKNGIMKIPQTQTGSSAGQSIPSWIKNNAGWWADNKIGDSDFVQGIQWLITNGIMKV